MKKSLKKIVLTTALIFFSCVVHAQNESKTNLSCTVNLTVMDKVNGERNSVEKFDLEIFDDKDGISILSSSSLFGVGINFGKRSFGRVGNVKNYSNESKIHFVYDVLQFDGTFFHAGEFRINRYTGSIFILQRIPFASGRSEGTCQVVKQKMF